MRKSEVDAARPTSWWRSTLALLTGIILALGTFNLIAFYVCDRPNGDNIHFGTEHLPGHQVRYQLEGGGISCWCSNNIRREAMPPPGSRAPILITGDSFTEALQVSDDCHFAHLLEKNLPHTIRRPVLACGHSGYSVADYLATAPDLLGLFSPYWVIIQINPDDFCADAWNESKASLAHFEWNKNSRLAPVMVDKIHIVSRSKIRVMVEGLAAKNSLFHLLPRLFENFKKTPLKSFYEDRKLRIQEWISQEKPWFKTQASSLAPPPSQPNPAYPIDWEMGQLADAYYHRLTILYLPPFRIEHPDQEEELEKQLAGAAQRRHVRFVSLREKFSELASRGLTPYGFDNFAFNSGHWNKYGHQAAAELLVTEMENIEEQGQEGDRMGGTNFFNGFHINASSLVLTNFGK